MHDFARRLTVSGLFGHMDHEVLLRTSEPTIITGTNGSGKTHVLNILRTLVDVDLTAFSKLPCALASLSYESGKTIRLERVEPDHVLISARKTGIAYDDIVVRINGDPLEEHTPSYIERISDEVWIDKRDGELMATQTVASRFGARYRNRPFIPYEVARQGVHSLDEILHDFKSSSQPTLVETQRLDSRHPGARPTGDRQVVSRIGQYVEQVATQITLARRRSLEVSQRADRQFAARALDKARATVQESVLRRRYEQLAQLNQELNGNGLTEPSAGVVFPGGRTNPTERRILSVFLEDWEGKLSALSEVHRKLQLLRNIVATKLTAKEMSIKDGQLVFLNKVSGAEIRVEKLSSGEQHLLALFTMLIFTAEPGTLVLIDEPEISLHAAWKHAFLADIRNVASLNDLQIVLATHSSGIVNGEWDLVEDLSTFERDLESSEEAQ